MPEAAVQRWHASTCLRADLVAQMGEVKRRGIAVLDRTFPALTTSFPDVCGLTAHKVLKE